MEAQFRDMRVIELTIENFMRIKAIRIKPDESLVIIAGENAQGKSSILNAVLYALDASKGVKDPVRHGEDNALIRVDLGDIIVEKIFKNGKWALKVYSRQGALFPSPATMLKELIGRLSFDPLDFLRLDAKQQVNALLDTVDLGLDLNALYRERDQLTLTRTEIGRVRDMHKGTLDSLGEIQLAYPLEVVSVGDLIAEAKDAQAFIAERTAKGERSKAILEEIRALETKIAELQEEHIQVMSFFYEGMPNPRSLEEINTDIDNLEATNDVVRKNQARIIAGANYDEADEAYKAHTEKLAALEKTKQDALKEATFPIAGVSFDDVGVTYNGVHLNQIASSEQIKVTLAISMALNPTVRLIYIRDGSLLDNESMKIVREMAEQNDFQVFIERVGDHDEMAIIIEDGEVQE